MLKMSFILLIKSGLLLNNTKNIKICSSSGNNKIKTMIIILQKMNKLSIKLSNF